MTINVFKNELIETSPGAILWELENRQLALLFDRREEFERPAKKRVKVFSHRMDEELFMFAFVGKNNKKIGFLFEYLESENNRMAESIIKLENALAKSISDNTTIKRKLEDQRQIYKNARLWKRIRYLFTGTFKNVQK
jgi:hypothetical protein